jgi:hypothetical protein
MTSLTPALIWSLLLTSGGPHTDAAAKLDFTEALAPLVIRAGSLSLEAGSCKDCHEAEFETWARSRHASATTNPLFRQGHRVEPRRRCVMCPAPRREQQPFVRSGRVMSGSLAEEGINCAVCHIRDGAILTSSTITAEAREAHPMKRDPLLATSEFCGACHQFRFATPDQKSLIETHAQLTYAEWRAWGGKTSCQTCHMADHSFPAGAHDDDALLGALDIKLAPNTLTLRTKNVGHRFPTGDVYRHLTVEAETDGEWRELHRIGLVLGFEDQDGTAVRTRASDNRLHPGELRKIDLPPADRVRVVYRFTTALNVKRGRLPPEVAERVLFEAKTLHSDRPSSDR